MLRWIALLALAGCATTIYPGEVGVQSTFGRLSSEPAYPGIVGHGPFGVRFYRVPTRNKAVNLTHQLTSRRGILIEVGASVLYVVEPAYAPSLIADIGPDYEREMLDPVFRWAAQRVYAEGRATSRTNIGERIRDYMQQRLSPLGIEVSEVILERSALTSDVVYRAFQERMRAEQQSEQMVYTLRQQTSEAERMVIEAEGQRDAYDILSDGLKPSVLANEALNTFQGLASSRNTRVIIGGTPILLIE